MVWSRYIRSALVATILIAIVGIVATISLKDNSAPTKPVSRQIPQNIDVSLQKAHFSEIRDGIVVWELIADRAEYDKSGEMAYLTGIRMEFAKSPSAGKIVVTAKTGEYSSKTRNVRLKGNVNVQTEAGAQFSTESIDYLAAGSQLVSSESVTFRHHRLELRARGMIMNVTQQVAHFKSMVDATVKGL